MTSPKVALTTALNSTKAAIVTSKPDRQQESLQLDHCRKRLILGSASPRRLEILSLAGIRPDHISPPDIDETPLKNEQPRHYVNRIAQAKAAALPLSGSDILLCADTTVTIGRRILGKPQNQEEAASFLQLLSGRRHRVITAMCVRTASQTWHKDVVSTVKVAALTPEILAWYLNTGDWQGKAGAYGIQGPASAFIPWISGSYFAIMGLPLPETLSLLKTAGYPTYS